MSELHIQHKPALRDFVGDPDTLPDLSPMLNSFNPQAPIRSANAEESTVSACRWRGFAAAVYGRCLFLLTVYDCSLAACLWPSSNNRAVAYSQCSSNNHSCLDSCAPAHVSADGYGNMDPATHVHRNGSSSTETAQPTSTHTPTPTNTSLPSPTIASAPVTIRPVWVRAVPDLNTPLLAAIPANTAVTILNSSDDWVEIEWQDATGRQQGWLGVSWLAIDGMPLTLLPPSEEP